MSDGEKKRIQIAFEIVKRASMKVKRGSDKWVQFVGMAMAFGWVLEEKVYFENCEALLRELKRVVGDPVTEMGGG